MCVRSFFCVPLPPIRIHKNKEKHFLLVIIRDGVGRLITKKKGTETKNRGSIVKTSDLKIKKYVPRLFESRHFEVETAQRSSFRIDEYSFREDSMASLITTTKITLKTE